MKTQYSEQAYQWEGTSEDGSPCWGTGVLVLTDGLLITNNGIRTPHEIHHTRPVLVAHSHTRELEFVEFGKLQKYPQSPIPEPTK